MAANSFLPFNFDFSKLFNFGGQQDNSFGAMAGRKLVEGVPEAGGLFSRQSLFGGTDAKTGLTTGGWAPVALGAGQALFGTLQGNKAMGLAERQFKEGVRQFDLNFNAQRQSINTDLEDRQRARVASNANAYEPVDSYLNKNKV